MDMWKIWLILDPRRGLIAVLVFCFSIVMLNHFIQLSTPRYGSWLTQPRPAAAAPRASLDNQTPMQVLPVVVG
jgi:light-harvesting complex 1 alpha chain